MPPTQQGQLAQNLELITSYTRSSASETSDVHGRGFNSFKESFYSIVHTHTVLIQKYGEQCYCY